MRLVAILNQKGGVGKTTTAVNLGAALAQRRRRVLLVDLDPQCNLTDHLGVEVEDDAPTIYDVLISGAGHEDAPEEVPLERAIVPTSTEGLDMVPADEDLAAFEVEMAGWPGREALLKRAIEALPADRYDWIVIDCPPSLGLLSINAMAACPEVFITLQTEYFALRGLGQLTRIVDVVRESIHPELRIAGILPTLVSPVTNLAREVLEEVRKHFGERVFRTRIRQNVRLAEAPGHGQHIFDYAPHSAGADDYRALAAELEGEELEAPRADAETAGPAAPEAATVSAGSSPEGAPAAVPPSAPLDDTAAPETRPAGDEPGPSPAP